MNRHNNNSNGSSHQGYPVKEGQLLVVNPPRVRIAIAIPQGRNADFLTIDCDVPFGVDQDEYIEYRYRELEKRFRGAIRASEENLMNQKGKTPKNTLNTPYRFKKGQYQGLTIEEVYKKDPSRIEWLANQNNQLGTLCRNFLNNVKRHSTQKQNKNTLRVPNTFFSEQFMPQFKHLNGKAFQNMMKYQDGQSALRFIATNYNPNTQQGNAFKQTVIQFLKQFNNNG